MERREIVRRAIEFDRPPRLPFFQHEVDFVPDDVCDTWEMDRARRGWFFDCAAEDDWGCGWRATDQPNMGQVAHHPLADWSALAGYRPPNPRDPFYFERLEADLSQAGDRYVVVTSHFNLIERLHMLHGFARTLEDFYLEPRRVEQVLDMILEFKIEQLRELDRRFRDRVHGIFITDDWGTQQGTYVGPKIFEDFFLSRYRQLTDCIHDLCWHCILHSCGRINDFVPYFSQAGVDVLNMQQPQAYGIQELGQRFAGRVCFLTTADIQVTLPSGDAERIRAEVRELVRSWATPEGGFIVYNYGKPDSLGVKPEMTEVMFRTFAEFLPPDWRR
ncbi:MAG: uroporphyrinogen decarboxylase family protein [Gemmatimonadota bacterium]